MDEEKVSVEMMGPERVFYRMDEVERVVVEAADGEMGILPGHTSLLSNLRVGRCTCGERSGERLFAISGGILENRDNRVKIFTRAAEEDRDIDRERARRAKERAEQRLRSEKKEIDIPRARAALARALNRLSVAARPGAGKR